LSTVWSIITTILTLLALSGLFALRLVGAYSHQALAGVLFLALIWGVISRLWWWKKERLHGRLKQTSRSQLFQALSRGYFWLILGFTTLIIFPRTSDMVSLIAGVAVIWLVVIGLQLLQPAQTNKGPSIAMLIGGLVLTFDTIQALWPTVDPVVRIATPFEGEWVVLQGGRSPLQSHHLSAYNQEYALDLVKLENGMIFKETEGNENLWSWEAPLYSPVDGTVVLAKGDMEDSEGLNLVSEQADAVGNTVIIQTADGHYVVFAHLRHGSVLVSEGQSVKTGDPIGKTGNTGNTTMPHLHFQVQTHQDIWHPDNRSIPFAFGDGSVYRRNDRITGVLSKAD
jgi:hypothetical protein